MKRDKHLGKCAICGEIRKLTYEHIPPKSAFNSQPTKQYNAFQSLGTTNKPWEFDGLKYINMQKGKGVYSLCRECNNNTGAWYGKDYCEFIQKLGNTIMHTKEFTNELIQVEAVDIYPLRILKQILSMFLSINKDYELPELSDFVKDKNSKKLDKSKYKICIYLYKGTVTKQIPLCAVGNILTGSMKFVSEIADFPIGIILYVNSDSNLKTEGTDITDFCSFDYNEKCDVSIPLSYKEVNTPIPCDFRTKDEVIKNIEENKKFIKDKNL